LVFAFSGARGGVGRDGFAATAAAAAVPIASGIVEQQAKPGVELVLLQLLIQQRGVMVKGVASWERKYQNIIRFLILCKINMRIVS